MQNDQTAKSIKLVKTAFNSIQTSDLETLGSLVVKDIVWHQLGENKFSS